MAEKPDFTLEDILAEERARREGAGEMDLPAPQPPDPVPDKPAPPRQETPAKAPAQPRPVPVKAPQPAPSAEPPFQEEEISPEEELPQEKPKKKKKKWGLFGRRKKMPDFDEGEDMYYGIQLKPLDEYRLDNDVPEDMAPGGDSFKALFDDSTTAIDQEVEENFQRLQKERRRRVAEAVQTAGVDEEQIADEFGVVAPMPVTAFAADPYARQHGIDVEGGKRSQEELPDIQRAMLETSSDQTMEIKLNVLNNTVELQQVQEGGGMEAATVSEETVHKILEFAPAPEEVPEPALEEHMTGEVMLEPEEALMEDGLAQEAPVGQEPAYAEEAQPAPLLSEREPLSGEGQAAEAGESLAQPAPEAEPQATIEMPAAPPRQKAPPPRPMAEIPRVQSIYEYRSRRIATHIIHADVLQSALLSESEGLQQALQAEMEEAAPRRRVKNKKLEINLPEEEMPAPDVDTGESIEDYTGPEDAKSIAHELRGDMHELSMRMMITGVCTLILTVVNLIFGGRFSAGGDVGSMPIIFIILTVVLAGVSMGICYRTVGNGLKALFSLSANSDSACAVAAVAVAVQTLGAVFFQSDLADGKLHLYAVVLTALLFLNAAGKLTMLRRIHSNFRFVTSREQKYAVRTFDDYNTSLKMTKDVVAEKPLVAYQCQAGFLKRFLELSYSPDPTESSSQLIAPIGLLSSLVLCICSLLVTKSVSSALSALAAACCACVAAGNMLAVNLPLSRLCKTARRAGAMVVSYEAIEKLGDVNAVVCDASELFPPGTVVLGGIKTFGNRIGAEEAIMSASALMKEIGGPLSSVFDQVISENEDALPEVEKFHYEPGGGIVGWVDGRKIYIGNRGLLINNRIEVPAREEETQYASGNKSIIYIAVDAAVAAMLVLTYGADRRKKNELQRMEDSGITVLVRTTDPNVTPALVARLFGIDTASVGILDGQLGQEAQKLMEEKIPRADALVATKGRMESMLSVISACVEQKRMTGLLVAIQCAVVVCGFILVAFMACFGGMRQLSSFTLFVFQGIGLLILLALPKLRK